MKRTTLVLLVLWFTTIGAAVPQQIHYQGYLTRSDESPLDTVVTMTFGLYQYQAGGLPVWTQVQNSCTVQVGLFAVNLGPIEVSEPTFKPDTCWLGVTIGNNSELVPRTRLLSVPFAWMVGSLDGADGGHVHGHAYIDNLRVDSLHCQLGIKFFDGSWQESAWDTNSLSDRVNAKADSTDNAMRTWVRSNGYLNSSTNVVSSGAFVGGGQHNTATGTYFPCVGGGNRNTANNNFSTVGGGNQNQASGSHSVVAGGGGSIAIGNYDGNYASGDYSMVPGGTRNRARGDFSLAAGRSAKANHVGSFVWGSCAYNLTEEDSTASFGDYTVTFRCSGGARFYTNTIGTTGGVQLPAGGGAWNNLCDVNQKRLHGRVNTAEILEKVTDLPLHQWSYQTQSENIRHIGPIAQDFHALFGVGDNNTTISTIDPDGIALAAIQELQKEILALRAEVKALREERTAASGEFTQKR